MELFKASQQWSTRPADERFMSLAEMYAATKRYAEESREKRVPFGELRVEANGGEVNLVGKMGIPAKFTHWAFGQLCSRIGAPASYLRELPPTLTCQNLNHGLAQRSARKLGDVAGNAFANLMFHHNGGLVLRSLLTDSYERIWNHEVCDRLLGLESQGWKPAVPTKRWDGGNPTECLACNGEGTTGSERTLCQQCKGTGKAGPSLYASDHDMFAFLCSTNLTVKERIGGKVYKGVIVENSEVGASSLKLTRFLFDEMCGNHIIWGATEVVDMAIRHVGDARSRWGAYVAAVRKYAEESVSDLEARIAYAQTKVIAATKEEVLDAVFGKRIPGLSRVAIAGGYDAAKPDHDGEPNTVWGLVQGLTRYSQTLSHTDARTQLDRAAGKVMDVQF